MTGTHDVQRRLLESTVEVLREDGVRGASPAAIAERAGASKMSIYRYFEGIDDLLATALGEYDVAHRARLLAPEDGSPRQRIAAMFDRAATRADAEGNRGCPYVSTGLAMPGLDCAVVEAAATHKQGMVDAIEGLLVEAGDPTPRATAEGVQLLMDGALVHAVLRGSGDPIRTAKTLLPRLSGLVFGPG